MKRHGSFIAAAGVLTLCAAASPAVAQVSPATARSEARAEAAAVSDRPDGARARRRGRARRDDDARSAAGAARRRRRELLVSDNAHARGFRLDGYGVFFDVDGAVVRDGR